MLRKLAAVISLCVALVVSALPAHAIDLNVVVLSSCGTVPTTLPTGTGYSLFTDQNGNLCGVNTAAPSSSNGLTPAPAAPALATSQVIKASAGNLYSFEVSVDSTLSAAPWWILIFDLAADPGNGAVTPRKCYAQVSGATSASYAWPIPIAFTNGIVIVASTTGCFTETQSAHAFISGDAK